MNWLLIISIIAFFVIMLMLVALAVCIAGYVYCLLYDFGMRAGLITPDEPEVKAEGE